MADLYPTIAQGDMNFDEFLKRQALLPESVRCAWQEANDAMSFARALAKAQFGSDATPDHAVAIFQAVTADIGRRVHTDRTDTE